MTVDFDYDNYPWGDVFYYDESSPSKLSWKESRYSLSGRKQETWCGKPAGRLCHVKNGDNMAYRVGFRFNNKSDKSFPVHRIIACLHGIKVNGLVIDHINGISSDNRIENLRATTQPVNSRNRRPQHNSPYGISGVGFQEDINGNGYFISRWVEDGKRVQKSFPLKVLGVMESFRRAVVSRGLAIRLLNQTKDAGYTERHTAESQPEHDNLGFYARDLERYAKVFRNQKLRFDNTFNDAGISFQTCKKFGTTSAIASWVQLDKRSRNKKFNVRKLGLLPAFKAAVEYRRKMIQELNDQGAGYSTRHGK